MRTNYTPIEGLTPCINCGSSNIELSWHCGRATNNAFGRCNSCDFGISLNTGSYSPTNAELLESWNIYNTKLEVL